ncbi:hypothetical protein [Burkholderia ubonensis]|uniref:hypothetical protein n=1 Tax=Burkholderia ubonensis TaxID=101571 RepID=UPI0009B440D1|nr:hypothetical protein [Burkholderia ubonensis]
MPTHKDAHGLVPPVPLALAHLTALDVPTGGQVPIERHVRDVFDATQALITSLATVRTRTRLADFHTDILSYQRQSSRHPLNTGSRSRPPKCAKVDILVSEMATTSFLC